MYKNLLKLGLSICILAVCAAWHGIAIPATGADGAKLTHPVHGHKANPLIELVYGPGCGCPASWSRGDITFPETYPPLAQLTEEEKYIIAGSSSSEWSAKAGLGAWAGAIFGVVSKFYDQYGYVPEQLTPAVLRSISGMERFGDENLREFLNPLTDKWPLLKAAADSPGDVYIRPLTAEEINYYAGKMSMYQDIWLEGRYKDPSTEEYVPVTLESRVFYMRIHGRHGVIHPNFMYSWSR